MRSHSRRTNACNKVDVGIGVRQTEPAALHGCAVLRLGACLLGRPHSNLAPLQLLPRQRARTLRRLTAVKLDEAKALQLAWGLAGITHS